MYDSHHIDNEFSDFMSFMPFMSLNCQFRSKLCLNFCVVSVWLHTVMIDLQSCLLSNKKYQKLVTDFWQPSCMSCCVCIHHDYHYYCHLPTAIPLVHIATLFKFIAYCGFTNSDCDLFSVHLRYFLQICTNSIQYPVTIII